MSEASQQEDVWYLIAICDNFVFVMILLLKYNDYLFTDKFLSFSHVKFLCHVAHWKDSSVCVPCSNYKVTYIMYQEFII